MKDYRLYEIEDFAMDEDFVRWVQGGGHADERFWNAWLAQNPAKHLVVAAARQIVESMRLEPKEVPQAEINREIGKVLEAVKELDHQYRQPRPDSFIVGKRWRIAAAVFPLVLAGTLWLFVGKQRTSSTSVYATAASSPAFIETVNGGDTLMTLVLPDSTSVRLAAGSRMTYANHFDSGVSRDVYLSGEAFFKVAGNPRRPFRVIANEIVTKVLGTSFSVRCFEQDTTIRVTVRTGKVSVSGIIVTPNQQLVYQRADRKFEKTLVESPSFIVPAKPDDNMRYEEKPVEQVFDQLSKYYGITIVYNSELLSKCTVTADLTNESFYHKLDLICTAIGAKYELLDGQVVIQSYGCQ
ncbi:MAG TPA: FecR domain-containing protein [Puia sp.]|nr:FecR domain-containing protein [Puia sp.]